MKETVPFERLDREAAEMLPAREALDLVNVQNITAVNLAFAVNAASPGAEAHADASQLVAAAQD